MRDLPPLNAVRAFEAAARHVSFTRAADELHVTHGAISRHVVLLESWLGTALFHRSSSRLTLTDAGRAYLSEVTSSLDRLALASLHIRQQARPTVLRVSAPPTFTMRWLIPRLSGYQRGHPDIEIRMTTSLAPVSFVEHEYDLAIRGAHQPPPGCRSEPFMTETIAPVCHVDLLERGALAKPADLARQTLINFMTEPYSWNEWLQAVGCAGLKPAGVLNFEQMFFALQAAVEGLGLVLVPLFLVADDIVAGRLCSPFGQIGAMQRRYYASVENSPTVNPAAAGFIDWLLREGRDTEASLENWARGSDPAR
ncbi:MAG: transcriptional regulator GcvA [Lautropia sp.]